jgi:ribosomal protein S18 acetylase RimI-like enzyme
MEIEHNIKLNPELILVHFTQLGESFIDKLEKMVDCKEYATKLATRSNMNGIFINQDLVGLIAYYRSAANKEIFISHVGVITDWQNKGFASKLVKSVIKESQGFIIRLELADDNLNARKLYESLNFKISGRFEAQVTMEKC